MKAQYERYAAIRDEKGKIDADVSRESGVPQSTFSDWKAERSAPKIEKLLKIAEAMGVDVMELFKDQADVEAERDIDRHEAIHGADGYLAQRHGVSAW